MRRAQGSDSGLMTACSLAASTKSLRDSPPIACVVSDRLTWSGASGRSPDNGSLARQSRPAGRGTPALDRPPPGVSGIQSRQQGPRLRNRHGPAPCSEGPASFARLRGPGPRTVADQARFARLLRKPATASNSGRRATSPASGNTFSMSLEAPSGASHHGPRPPRASHDSGRPLPAAEHAPASVPPDPGAAQHWLRDCCR